MNDQADHNCELADIDLLISEHLPCDQSRITSTRFTRLNSCEHHCGYTVWKVKLELVNTTTGEEWELHVLAKTLPDRTKVQDFCKIEISFKKELGLFKYGRDTLNKFLKSRGVVNGIECMETYFGGRHNLNGSNVIDADAVVLLSDLKKYGFRRLDRRRGLDIDCTKTVLRALAELHGSTLALKYQQHSDFERNIKPHLSEFHISRNLHKITREQMVDVLKEEGFPFQVIQKAIMTFDRRSIKNTREPWATMIHNNTWVENIMFRYDKKHYPAFAKLIDFRISEYQSPARDLIFFLFTSVQLEILETQLDDLIDFYYHTLINLLQSLDVETWPYARWTFNEELRLSGRQSEFFKTVSMLYSILDAKLDGSQTNITDPVHRKRLCFLVKEFEKRDWLCV